MTKKKLVTAAEAINLMVKSMVAIQVIMHEPDADVFLDMPYGRFEMLEQEVVRQHTPKTAQPQQKGRGVFGV